jgi:hypothetical protein
MDAVCGQGWDGKCASQCDCMEESSDDMMFLKVYCLDILFFLLHLWYRKMKLPSFSKYPTWRSPSLHVFLLMRPRELSFNTSMHDITAKRVVGRFSSSDVKFLGRLKKPVMTKRNLPAQPFTCRSHSAARATNVGSHPCGGILIFSSLSLSRTLERCVSDPSPPQDRNRLTSPLSHSHIPSSSPSPSATRLHSSDKERGGFGLRSMHPPPMSYYFSSTLSDSVATTPAFAAFPLHAEPQHHSSPSTSTFPVAVQPSASTSIAGSEPPTRPSLPPDNLSSD